MPDALRKILHIDMDAFYASVEQRDDPALRGRPVAVGGAGGRGVVAAASYEARRFGVRSAMPGKEALRRCPDLVFVRPDFAKYKAVSAEVFAIFREVTPHVEGLSLDEAYLDVTENAWHEPSATRVAERIKARIQVRVGLTASAGVAPTKSVAKIASAMNKPDGLTVVPPDRVLAFLQPLPVEKLWGVGPVMARRLHALDLHTIGDVATTPEAVMAVELGNMGRHLWALANGRDVRRVSAHRDRKSASAERTFAEDTTDLGQLDEVMAGQAERVCAQLTRGGRRGRTVTVKVRYSDFTTITRSVTLPEPTADPGVVIPTAARLLRTTDAGRRPVRLVGVGLSGFGTATDDRQLSLPFEGSGVDPVEQALAAMAPGGLEP
jgi:DNA polymerase-4